MYDGKVVWVTSDGCDAYASNTDLPIEFGAKARGLTWIPSAWVPPYFVIAPDVHRQLKPLPPSERIRFLDSLQEYLSCAGAESRIQPASELMLRSNALRETLRERGKYASVRSTPTNLLAGLAELYAKLDAITPSESLGVIVQEHIQPVLKGHLSNERRVAEEYRDGLILLEDQSGSISEKRISFRRWRSGRSADEGALLCAKAGDIPTVLRQPLAFSAQANKRAHFEWVWDGHFVHIVQADLADEKPFGTSPDTVLVGASSAAPQPGDLKYFSPVSARDSASGKMRNHAIYLKHGFWQPTFYRLSDKALIDRILRAERDPDLAADLQRLTVRPLVIRTSCSRPAGPLLPRSNLLTNAEAAQNWLFGAFAQGIREKDIDSGEITLLAHHFIPAKVAAFSTGTPEKLDVYVEALWGIPEGLYYYPFDSYTVHTLGTDPDQITETDIQRFEQKANLRHKSHFVAPDEAGQFMCYQLAPPWDWKPTIADPLALNRMAAFTRRLAKIEGHPVSLMWFISCVTPDGSVDLVPWYHERLSNLKIGTNFRSNARDELISVSTEHDLAQLESRQKSAAGNPGRLVLELSPVEDQAIRSESFATRVGAEAKRLGAVVILNGASLSHIYYVLARTGAEIVARNIGDAVRRRQVHEKLVRDKIPDTVAAGGEIAHVANLTKEQTIAALRIKLVEEAFEVRDAPRDALKGELADVLEVVDALTTAAGFTSEEVDEVRRQKAAKRGKFDLGLVLIETTSGAPAAVDAPLLESAPAESSRVIHSDRAPPLERMRPGPADSRDTASFLEFVQNGSVSLTHPEWTMESPGRNPLSPNIPVDSLTWSIDGKRTGTTLKIRVKIRIGRTQMELPFEAEEGEDSEPEE